METAPLSINLNMSEVTTAMPLVANQHICQASLASLEQVSGDKGITLVFTYKLTAPAPTTTGDQVSPGYQLKDFVQLYSKPDSKKPLWYLEKIAKHLDAMLGTGDAGNKAGKPERPALSPELVPQLIGLPVLIEVGVREYNGVSNNEIKRIFNPAELNR